MPANRAFLRWGALPLLVLAMQFPMGRASAVDSYYYHNGNYYIIRGQTGHAPFRTRRMSMTDGALELKLMQAELLTSMGICYVDYENGISYNCTQSLQTFDASLTISRTEMKSAKLSIKGSPDFALKATSGISDRMDGLTYPDLSKFETQDPRVDAAQLINDGEILINDLRHTYSEDAIPAVLLVMASDAYDQNQFELAAQGYLAYLSLVPDDPVQIYNLAMTYESLNMNQESLKSFERYLELEPQTEDRGYVEGKIQELNGNSQ